MKVYRKVAKGKVKCSLGRAHDVHYYEVKRLTFAADEFFKEFIKALRYIQDDWGICQVAYDYQGRRYVRKPHWDGWNGWVREDHADEVFFQRPLFGGVSFDVYGNLLS